MELLVLRSDTHISCYPQSWTPPYRRVVGVGHFAVARLYRAFGFDVNGSSLPVNC